MMLNFLTVKSLMPVLRGKLPAVLDNRKRHARLELTNQITDVKSAG